MTFVPTDASTPSSASSILGGTGGAALSGVLSTVPGDDGTVVLGTADVAGRRLLELLLLELKALHATTAQQGQERDEQGEA